MPYLFRRDVVGFSQSTSVTPLTSSSDPGVKSSQCESCIIINVNMKCRSECHLYIIHSPACIAPQGEERPYSLQRRSLIIS